jgi:hypothetical protein
MKGAPGEDQQRSRDAASMQDRYTFTSETAAAD